MWRWQGKADPLANDRHTTTNQHNEAIVHRKQFGYYEEVASGLGVDDSLRLVLCLPPIWNSTLTLPPPPSDLLDDEAVPQQRSGTGEIVLNVPEQFRRQGAIMWSIFGQFQVLLDSFTFFHGWSQNPGRKQTCLLSAIALIYPVISSDIQGLSVILFEDSVSLRNHLVRC